MVCVSVWSYQNHFLTVGSERMDSGNLLLEILFDYNPHTWEEFQSRFFYEGSQNHPKAVKGPYFGVLVSRSSLGSGKAPNKPKPHNLKSGP